tara:strand:+ start:54 stop:686 length:633 start_codon:yes stop_codon:yes gene_type:complete
VDFNIFIAIGIGVASAFYFGPAFWVLLETSLTKGIRAALAFDIGVVFADIVFIIICYFGLSKSDSLFENNKQALFILGGAVLLIYGIVSWINRGKQEKRDAVIKNVKGGYAGLIIKGFLLSFMNIMVFFYWLSVSTSLNAAANPIKFFSFFSVVVAAYLITDLFKIGFANRFSSLLTDKRIKSFKSVIAIILIVFGSVLVYAGSTGNTGV